MKTLKVLSLVFMVLFYLSAKSQINDKDCCTLYSLTTNELEKSINKFDSSFVISKKSNKYSNSYFPDILQKRIRTQELSCATELMKLEIDANRFDKVTDNSGINCEIGSNRFINGFKYLKKGMKSSSKYKRKNIALCTFSNIGNYENVAVIEVIVNLSYGRNYINYYFLKKEVEWQVVYSILEIE